MISITLDGYFRDPRYLPHEIGIYVVYACRVLNGAINYSRIIYIGQANDLRERHYKNGRYVHERLSDFNKECKNGEELYYCYAPIDPYDLDKVENALILMQQPALNTHCTDIYNYEADYFKLYGNGSNPFRLSEFGFERNYDKDSLYTKDEICFE